LPDFKIGEIAPCRFSKVLRDIFHLIEAKDLIASFEKLSANSKAFGAKW
jgi:hypothetical protein